MVRTFDAQTRKTIKQRQKANIRSHYSCCVLANLLCLLPSSLIGLIAMHDVGNSIQMMSATPDLIESMDLLGKIYSSALLALLLTFLIGSPLQFGLQTLYIKLMRGQEAPLSTVVQPFHSFRSFWRSLKMQFSLAIRSIAWLLPFTLIMTFILSIIVGYSIYMSVGSSRSVSYMPLIIGYVITYIGAWLLSIRVSYYNAGYMVAVDDEIIGTWAATSVSCGIFKGHYWDLLKFYLSFFLWQIPSFIALAIVLAAQLFHVNTLLASALMFLITLFYGSFIQAYIQASFYQMFDHLKPVPEESFSQTMNNVQGQPGHSYQPNPSTPTLDAPTSSNKINLTKAPEQPSAGKTDLTKKPSSSDKIDLTKEPSSSDEDRS